MQTIEATKIPTAVRAELPLGAPVKIGAQGCGGIVVGRSEFEQPATYLVEFVRGRRRTREWFGADALVA